jgi:LDH2 family malate/lactate/ureidoglycolate dehydrogenase
MPLAQFEAQVDDIWAQMKSSALLPGGDEVRLPGEQSNTTFLEREARGVPIHRELRASLDGLADSLGVARIGEDQASPRAPTA